MASSETFCKYVLEQLSKLKVTAKQMMGEYLLYCNGVLFGGVYDDRLLVKIVPTNAKYNLPKAIAYQGAKPMYIVEDVDNVDILTNIVNDTCGGLLLRN